MGRNVPINVNALGVLLNHCRNTLYSHGLHGAFAFCLRSEFYQIMTEMLNWARQFDKPIQLSSGEVVFNLREALTWLTKTTPKVDYGSGEIVVAVHAIRSAAENIGSMVAVQKALETINARRSAPEAIEALLSTEIEPPQERFASADKLPPSKSSKANGNTALSPLKTLTVFTLTVGKRIGVDRFINDQRMLVRQGWIDFSVRRDTSEAFQSKDLEVEELLRIVREAGGALYWPFREKPSLAGLEKAVRAQLVVRFRSINQEGITLTKKGRVADKMNGAVSFRARARPNFSLLALKKEIVDCISLVFNKDKFIRICIRPNCERVSIIRKLLMKAWLSCLVRNPIASKKQVGVNKEPFLKSD